MNMGVLLSKPDCRYTYTHVHDVHTPTDSNATHPRQKELPWAGFKPMLLCILGRYSYQLNHKAGYMYM